MKAEETRRRLMFELQTQFSGTDDNIVMDNDIVNNVIEKPMMFMPNIVKKEEIIDNFSTPVKGIGFKNKVGEINEKQNEVKEIYSMKELIDANPECMRTISYDENVVKTQLALVKKKEWQDILFEDIDWFKQIDLTSGIKRLFRIS